MTDQATVRRQAEHFGLHLVSTNRGEELNRWWLSSSYNWVTTEPGKPLDGIAAVLDEMDGGEWARQEAEAAERAAERAAEQEALRQQLAAEAAERAAQAQAEADDDDGQDEDDVDEDVPAEPF